MAKISCNVGMVCRHLPIGSYISGPCLAILNFSHNTPLCMLLQTLSFLQKFHPECSGIEIVMNLLNFDVELMLWKVVSYFVPFVD